MTSIRYAFAVVAFLAGTAGATPAVLLRDSPLRAEPALNSPELVALKTGTKLEVLANQGGWSKVNAPTGQTGWVRLLVLQPQAAASGSAFAGVDTLGNVLRTGSTGAVATTGAKGIDREQLAKAKPDFDQLTRLDQAAADADTARRFADEVKLVARVLDYVDAAGKPQKGGGK